MGSLNDLRWDGRPGHYEVYYLTTTDPESGVGLWIRSTMLAPDEGEPTCSLWFVASTPDAAPIARKATFPIGELEHDADPFRLVVGGATLGDHGYDGTIEDVSWDLTWAPGRHYEHVHPLLRRLRVAKTVLTLPHGDVKVSGTVRLGDRVLTLDGAHGGQAHLWGSKHARRWAWAHCGDFATPEGEPVEDTFLDGVSVFVPRFGREVGPSTPVVGRFLGRDFAATSPRWVLRARSEFDLSSWIFEARDGARRIIAEVSVDPVSLAGVTYTDPDGEHAYCYNSEAASMRVRVHDDDRLVATLVSDGRAHFEYAQREPVAGAALLLT